MQYRFGPYFPFRRDNRKPDGTWDAPDATRDNIKRTSVDLYEPVWPRWRQTPPRDGEGDFISDEPFFDIDEITQKAKFYPPGRPLVDRNVDGNPARRQRVGDSDAGNLWRRRLLVAPGEQVSDAPAGAQGGGTGDAWASGNGARQGLLSAATFGSHPSEDDVPPMAFAHQRFAGAAPNTLPPARNPSPSMTPANPTTQSGGTAPIRGSRSQNTIIYDHADGSRVVRQGGTRTWRLNNPGAIENGQHARSHGAIGTDGRFAIFPDEATGIAALDALLTGPNYQAKTIDKTIMDYAPPNENNTAAYQAFVARRLGVPGTTPLSQLTPSQLLILRDAIKTYEGWRSGTNTQMKASP